MKVTLYNFGCYSDKTFSFKDKFTLFEGPNGSGKSTVFRAICYALYGKCKSLKYGETSSFSQIETTNWTVKRVSKPMSLTLIYKDKKYEDARAQSMIEDHIIGMSWEQFGLCTWVGSTSKASLATITPTERYNVIRTMVANTEETQGDCEKISQYERQIKDDQVKLKSRQSALTRVMDDMSGIKEPEVKEIPKNLKARIQKLEKEIVENETVLRKIGLSRTKMTRKEIKQRIQDIQLRPQIVEKIALMKKYLIYARKMERQQLDLEEFEKAKHDYFESVQQDLDENTQLLEDTDEALLKDLIRENTLRAIAKDNENPYWNANPSDIAKMIKNASKAKVSAQMKETKQPCPRCKADVCIDGDSVLKYLKSYDKAKISTSQDDLEFLEALSDLSHPYTEDCEHEYDRYSRAKLRIKECRRILDKKVLTAELNRKNKSIGSIVKRPEGFKDKYSVEYLGERIEDLAEQLGGIEEEDDNEIQQLKQLLKNDSDGEDFEEVEATLSSLRKKLSVLHKSESAQVAIDQWKTIKEKLGKVTANLEQCEIARKTIDKRLEATSILKTKQREAEILSMQNLITSVNTLASDYLEKFFDEPISVSITMIKRTRNNTKMSLEISAQYRGHRYTDVGDFSQGEIIKINLAFILALNQLNNSPFLLLDEIMVNIDKSIISEVYTILKEISRERPIFVIDHNAVQGIFDGVVEFGD